MTSPYAQHGFRVGFDWGPAGAAAVPGSLVAVVDVLSFTTAVTVAIDRGIEVFPYRWRDETAVAYAEQHDAVLAVGRSQPGITLSPVSIRQAQDVQRLVLPSPNGSTISQQLADSGSTVLAVSLRNTSAAAAWVAAKLQEDPSLTVVAIAAGAFHTLALRSDGAVWGFGDASSGQLGDSAGQSAALPQKLSGLGPVDLVASGLFHGACASAKGEAFVWGLGANGQLGLGDGSDYRTPQQLPELVRLVSAGTAHTLFGVEVE